MEDIEKNSKFIKKCISIRVSLQKYAINTAIDKIKKQLKAIIHYYIFESVLRTCRRNIFFLAYHMPILDRNKTIIQFIVCCKIMKICLG